MARLALGIVGGVIGGIVAPGIGASIGFAIGSALGSFLEPKPQGPTIEGPRLGDLTAPGGAEGTGIPILRGTVRVPGRVIWSTQIVEVRTEEEIESEGGKGGGGSGGTSISYSYNVSFAVSLCDGAPSGVTGIRRIWADSKLIFSVADGADPATFQANSSHGVIRVYLGSETQTPDTLIAASVGADDQSAFRGTCYLVFESLQLADFANHRPLIEAEVIFAGTVTHPVETHTLEVGYPDVSAIGLDLHRNKVILTQHEPVEGEWIWRWGGGDDAPVKFAKYPEDSISAHPNAENLNALHDEWEDEYVIFQDAGDSGLWANRFDAGTGAWLGTSTDAQAGVSSSGSSDPLVWNTELAYDRINRCFWGVAAGFNSGELYFCKVIPSASTNMVQFAMNIGTASWGPGINKTPVIDGSGRCYLVGGSIMVRCGNTPEVVTLPAASAIKAFSWTARGEIWVARNASHGTLGWMVYNVGTETFSNSVDLGLGSWTVNSSLASENANGQAWFLSAGTDGALRNTDGTLVDSFTGSSADISDGVFYLPGVLVQNPTEATSIFEYSIATNGILLSELVTYICSLAGASSVGVSSLASDTCRGYLLASPMPARGALEPLMGAFIFDGVEHDGVLTFVKRGGVSVATLTEDDMGAMKEGSSEIPPTVLISRALESELPSTIYLRFANQDLDYNVGVARARRQVTETVHVVEIDFPITFNSEEGNQAVDRIMRYAWLEQERFEFSLKPRWRILEPTDVVTLPDGQRVRLTKVDYESNGPVRCEAVSDDDGALISYAVGNGTEVGTGILLGTEGPSTAMVLDLPLLIDAHTDEGLYVGAGGESAAWDRAVVYYSRDGGVTWIAATVAETSLKIGSIVSGAMAAGPVGAVWDHESEIVVKIAHPSLAFTSAASLDTFYQGANALAISDNGEDWEIVQFYTAAVTAGSPSEGTYTLKDFLRGRKGTEHLTSAYSVGARVVALDMTSLSRVAFSLGALGTDTLWKAVTTGRTLEDAATDEEVFDAVSCMPYSPVEVAGAKQANGDFKINWTRRARKDGEWRNGGNVPLDEDDEVYEIDLYDEDFGTLLRSTEVTDATTLTYTAAEVAADHGSPTVDPLAIGVRVYQISARVGRGYAGEGVIGREVDSAMRFSETVMSTGITVSQNGHRAAHNRSDNYDWGPTDKSFADGRFYFEVVLDYIQTPGSARFIVGVTNRTTFPATVWGATDFYGARDDSNIVNGTGGFSIGIGDVVMVAWDATNGRVYFGKNGTWQNGANPATGSAPQATYTPSGAWRPVVVANNNSGAAWTVTARFGQGHAYGPPTGFVPIN